MLYRGRFYTRSAQFTSSYREYRYIKDRSIGVLSDTFYCNFCWDIAYSLLYRGYRYIEDRYIGVALYLAGVFHFRLEDGNLTIPGTLTVPQLPACSHAIEISYTDYN